jgi:hypothetical protein
VVEAHRAGPLTLAAFRLPGAEALSGGILENSFQFSVVSSQFSALVLNRELCRGQLKADN